MPKVSLEYVRPLDLKIDRQYQRSLNERFMNTIIREYNPDDLGVLIASRRADGDIYCLDGQHRASALIAMNKGDVPVPVMVYENLSMGQEAEMFTSQTKSRTIHPTDLYKARLFAGDKKIMAINKIVEDAGFHITNQGYYPAIRSPVAIIDIYTRYGKDQLINILDMAAFIFADERRAIPVAIIEGMNEFVVHYGQGFDRDRFMMILKDTPKSKLDEMAGAMGRFVNERARVLYARAMRELYNGKLKESRRLPPWDISLTDPAKAPRIVPDVGKAAEDGAMQAMRQKTA